MTNNIQKYQLWKQTFAHFNDSLLPTCDPPVKIISKFHRRYNSKYPPIHSRAF